MARQTDVGKIYISIYFRYFIAKPFFFFWAKNQNLYYTWQHYHNCSIETYILDWELPKDKVECILWSYFMNSFSVKRFWLTQVLAEKQEEKRLQIVSWYSKILTYAIRFGPQLLLKTTYSASSKIYFRAWLDESGIRWDWYKLTSDVKPRPTLPSIFPLSFQTSQKKEDFHNKS